MSFPKTNGNTRKKYTPQFKFNLAKESIKTGNISEVSRKYGVGVNLLSMWIKHLNDGLILSYGGSSLNSPNAPPQSPRGDCGAGAK